MSSGLCWHTPYGPAPSWTTGCHAGVLAPVAQYVAPAPVAPVVLAAAAPLVLYEKVAFDTNVLFDSNKSDLRPAARDSLDAFVGKIGGLESQSETAIGYADRMGTDASNQLLSEDRVKTSAWGEKRPDTNAAQCEDANNAKNVACMQPDRHVFIEVSGSRIAK